MKKIYQLSTCNTCQRIISDLGLGDDFENQNLKERNISAEELDSLKEFAGSYEALFNKRAIKYRKLGLREMNLTEEQFREWILKEYTFLKRPIIICGDEIFIGNSKKTVAAANRVINGV